MHSNRQNKTRFPTSVYCVSDRLSDLILVLCPINDALRSNRIRNLDLDPTSDYPTSVRGLKKRTALWELHRSVKLE